MGLIKLNADLLRTCLLAWAIPLIVTATGVMLVLYGDAGRALLQYDRALIVSGEVHRLLTGHLVHLTIAHAALNLAGLWFVWVLVGQAFSTPQWLLVIAVSVAAIDLGFLAMLPELAWYVGLSGVLHGMLAAGIVGIWRSHRREAAILAVAVSAKIAWETVVGPLPGSESAAGGTVISEAHLLGAIGGLAAALLIRVRSAI